MIYNNQSLKSSTEGNNASLQGVQQGAALNLENKKINQSAFQANQLREVEMAKMASQSENYKNLNDNKLQMQGNAQQFQAGQNELDRQAQEKLAKRNLMLQQKKFELDTELESNNLEARRNAKLEYDRLTKEENELAASHLEASIGSEKNIKRGSELRGRMQSALNTQAGQIDNLNEDAVTSIQQVLVDVQSDIAKEIASSRLGSSDLNSSDGVNPLTFVDDGIFAAATEELGNLGSQFTSMILNGVENASEAVVDGLATSDDQIDLPTQQAIRKKVEELQNGGADRIVARRLAGSMMNFSNQATGAEEESTRLVVQQSLENLIVSVFDGDTDTTATKSTLAELGIDQSVFGSMLYAYGENAGLAAVQNLSEYDRQDQDDQRLMVGDEAISKHRQRAIRFGRNLRGPTSDQLRAISQRLDQSLSESTAYMLNEPEYRGIDYLPDGFNQGNALDDIRNILDERAGFSEGVNQADRDRLRIGAERKAIDRDLEMLLSQGRVDVRERFDFLDGLE